MRSTLRLSFFFVVLSASVIVSAQGVMTRSLYIEKYHKLAINEMNRVGIPASIKLAQGMLESGNGNSVLARKSNNHFGIKCHNDWRGKKVYHDDDHRGECFRKYKSVYESYIDHSSFLTGKQRYASLFDLKPTDYKGWAKGLKKAGYATDPRYAHRLIHLIEENDLHRFDKGGTSVKKYKTNDSSGKKSLANDNFSIDAFSSHQVELNNGVKYVSVHPDDSFEKISNEFGLKNWELTSYNDLPDNARLQDYKYIYVQPKRNKAHRKHRTHRVKPGETLHYISQKYGVKLKRLYRYNRIEKGEPVSEGQIIQLRKKKR
ncbi:glucosaminidase domain-containing protein [Saccharicrinis carchari]|nr:glucosaminidase domain-containing protein [Saccharicrinis carchari]